MLASALSAVEDRQPGYHMGLYMAILYLGGYLVTSRAFRALHDEAQRYAWVTAPGSQIEKFAAKLLLTSIGYALGSLAAYLVTQSLFLVVGRFFSDDSPSPRLYSYSIWPLLAWDFSWR